MARKRTAITFGVALWLLALAAATAGITSAETTPPAGARLTEEGWFAKPVTTAAKPALPEEITRAFVIPIREPISEKTFKAMRRKVISCKSTAAELVVFDMDTWGGDAIAALDIARMMKTDLKNIYTVCYVRTRAISAGALIAMSCDEIVMTPVGAFGDCAPISMGQKLEGVEREKIETELRREFRESSKRNGYHVALAQSMVSHDLEVWLIRNKKTSELRYVLEEEWKGRVDIPHAVKPTLTNPKSDWLFVRTVVSKGKLLTVDAAEAREYGFIRHIIDPPEGKPLSGLMEHYNVKGEPTILADTWSEKLVGFLTSPVLSGILFFVAIIALYTELNTPGFGVAGTIAIICFAILFGSRFLIGLAAWWEIALFIVGLILIATEVFVTPGFGVLGVSGLLC
ncbi:MAG: hypothetical protein KAU28_07070, partial [Phycisphaerae bacterium]|nr:hypothetical protein [Phycisphaerae bacterium]